MDSNSQNNTSDNDLLGIQDNNSFEDANEVHLNPTTQKEKKQRLNPKEIEDIFKQSIPEKKPRSHNQNHIYLLISIIVVVGFILLWQLNMQRQIETIKADLNITAIPDEQDFLTATPIQKIAMITPEEFAQIDGEVQVNMEVEGINFVNMKIFDDNGVEIGSSNFNTSDSLRGKMGKEQTINVSKSPTTGSGYLIVYPGDKPLNSLQSVTISLNFVKNTVVNRLNLVGPLSNQLINTSNLRFTGEMKGFAGNTVKFILQDEDGKELSQGDVVASTQEESGGFVKFDKTIEIGTLPTNITEKGQINFVDTSVENSPVLLSIPVRFK